MAKHSLEAYKWSIENRSLIADSIHEALAAAFDAGRAAQNVGCYVVPKGDVNPKQLAPGSSIPRRCRIDLYTPAERAISDAMYAVEGAGADPRLTNATCLLAHAKDEVASYVEAQANPVRGAECGLSGNGAEIPQAAQ